MSPAESNRLAATVNQRNAEIGRRAERLANVLLAIALGALGALALLIWATPCEDNALCMLAVATPARRSLWARATSAVQHRLLRWHLADTEAALRQVQTDLAELPGVQEELEVARSLCLLRLQAIELSRRQR